MDTSHALFPERTAWSVILTARDAASPEGRDGFERLVRTYWPAVRAYLMRRWACSADDAADLTQEFFARLYEDDLLRQASPARGRFRTFVKLKLRDLVVDDLRVRCAVKRGGGALPVPLSPATEDRAQDPEGEFDRAWARSIVHEAIDELRGLIADHVFRAFRMCVLDHPPSSARDCAHALGLKEKDVRNYVFRTRERLRHLLLRRVAETVGDERETEDELAHLMNLLVR